MIRGWALSAPRKWSKIACGVTQQIWGVFAPFFEPDGIAVVDIPAHDLLHIYGVPGSCHRSSISLMRTATLGLISTDCNVLIFPRRLLT